MTVTHASLGSAAVVCSVSSLRPRSNLTLGASSLRPYFNANIIVTIIGRTLSIRNEYVTQWPSQKSAFSYRK